MKKFYYITNARIPTEKAHGIQIMEMSAALSGVFEHFELVLPKRTNSIKEDPFVYHDIDKKFSIRRLPSLDLIRFGKIGFLIQSLSFAESAAFFALNKKNAVFYTRDELVALFLAALGKKVFWEGHTGQKNIVVRSLIAMKVSFVTITEGLKDLYVSLGVPESNILVAPDGADISRFDIPLSKEDAKKKLSLPKDKKIVLYKGSLGVAKGAGTLAAAAKHVERTDVQFVFIGGKPEDVEAFKKEFPSKNISILGNRPRQETPIYQKAADILVIPNSAKDEVSKLYTSPMKLFGYMAGGRPIVASDLPSIREVLNENLAYFFTPDDPKSLASAVSAVLDQEEMSSRKAGLALEEARKYSWDTRAESIAHFIDSK